MTTATLSMSPDLGTRIIGRCFLPFHTKERIDGGFDLLFQLRSNFGGLRESSGFGICLEYRKREKRFILKIKEAESPVEIKSPLLIVNEPLLELGDEFNFQDYSLVKPNKHFLKRYERSVFCKGGVLTIPLIFTNSNQEQLEGVLNVYPSVVDGKEFLVVSASNLPLLVTK